MLFKDLLNKFSNKFVFFDGAMGTMLQRAGLKVGELPETLNITNSEIIRKVHREYLNAGSDIIITNTFGANELKYSSSDYTIKDVITAGVKIAKEEAKDKLVALDIGPTGQVMEPTGSLSFESAYELFKSQVIIGEKAGADIILIETMSDLYEAKAAILAAKENSSLPIFCTMTFQQDGRTLMGTDPKTMVFVLESLGVDALGVNCSLGPGELQDIVDEILKYSSIPVIVQPNAGLPKYDGENTIYDITSDEFAENVVIMAKKGVRFFGGCCGTSPEFIKTMVKSLKNIVPLDIKEKNYTTVCSARDTVFLGNRIKFIGERINPTGRDIYKKELKEGKVNFIQKEAVKQKEEGAHILGLNVGLPEINEVQTMKEAVKAIQKVVQLPIDIDSPNPKVLEAGVRVYNGKPIINSVNGRKKCMEEVFPIVKKYGGCVIALTIDENGIPDTAEGRVKIAEKIIKTAENYGIKRKDIIVDCLTLTASAQQKEVLETIKAIKILKEQFGVKTTLGVSNISYGLPRRCILNRTFLALALQAGLDLPIINTSDKGVKDIISAFEVLTNIDKEGKEYVKKYSGKSEGEKAKWGSDIPNSGENDKNLKQTIIDGMEEEAVELTCKLLKSKKAVDIVNSYIIPALDEVGVQYENKDIFLPQLIQSAETVKQAFEIIKKDMLKSGENKISRGKIILATVKGDIHDIGKNIVKVLLENYGFEVIDLGRDVDISEVVDAIIKNNVKLVGLSALMTTTVSNMKKTIDAIRDKGLQCKVVVGGAVLNQNYADMIGADYYAKDARETVKIAEELFSV
ncbi:homocysteine S-methyltransferase family protein [Clostridium autoethanogenum]|uniref:Methionine synthase n=2 Tax=Clostridium autoethanogenum TaxID=84023 RepID=A0ABM5NWQ1_9CLOT|nr:homocysteine S-methyltransferase family protein [Clostridium autoethanogenum]AGY76962.1 homocysteine S-methyltransferase family protein [Clostridium autoethanogenum DSM 10061]ALU37105.1 Homocysteine Methyltransferase [Clostridium autoethanogenum DSM 10061]OVY50322.1 Methionine synthase [Clostridium autoethanogenum]